jgi:CRP/FNR family transcriptional regulator
MADVARPTVRDGLLEALDSSECAPLAPRAFFGRGQVIGAEGEPCEELVVLQRGRVLLSRQGMRPDSAALYLVGPGDLLGVAVFGSERKWTLTARAVTDTVARQITRPNIRRLLTRRPELAEDLLARMADRLYRAHRRCLVSTNDSARQRVLALLCLMSDYHGEPAGDEVWLPLHLSQAQMGEMVGLARETVARTMTLLEDEGLIRKAQRRGFWLRLPEDVVMGGLLLRGDAAVAEPGPSAQPG